MKKTDTRVQLTRAMFRKGLMQLLKEKPIGKIKIGELCDTAGLNRGTFYLHYREPQDVLKDIENHFVEENMAFFSAYWDQNRDRDVMAELFRCILQNREVCRILMGEKGDPQFLVSLSSLIREGIVAEWQKEFPQHDQKRLDFLFDYVFHGSMRLILNWLENDQGLSVQEFSQRLERLGHYSLVAAGEFL